MSHMKRLIFAMAVLAPAVGYGQSTGCGGLSGAEYSSCMATAPKKSPPPTATQQEAYQAAVDRSAQEKARLAAEPVKPYVGMTSAQWEQLRLHNAQRLTAYQKAHPLGSNGGSDEYNPEWGKWDFCTPNTSHTARGKREQWVCSVGRERGYVYVDNGVVTAVQE